MYALQNGNVYIFYSKCKYITSCMWKHTIYILQGCTNKIEVYNIISKYSKLNAQILILIKTYERVDNCPKTGIYMVKLVYYFQVVLRIQALKTPHQ